MPGLRNPAGKDTLIGCTSMNTDRAIELAVELQEQAWNLQAEGKLGQAATACGKALLLLQESGAADSPDAANLLNDLAEIESERQNFQEALVLTERAQSIEDRLGNGFAGEGAAQIRARTMGLIGEICRLRGDFASAALAQSCAEAVCASAKIIKAKIMRFIYSPLRFDLVDKRPTQVLSHPRCPKRLIISALPRPIQSLRGSTSSQHQATNKRCVRNEALRGVNSSLAAFGY